MTSVRPAGDKTWNYFRLIPAVKPHVMMKPVDGNSYELVLLETLKSKILTNSNVPPNSFYTRDLFVPHPTIPGAWKYLTRLDDRITLLNGEKALPLPIEGRIKEEVSVKEAVVFGIGKAVPGVLAFRSESVSGLSDEEFTDLVWPAVQDANRNAEAFSQIDKKMIVPMPSDLEYPHTDKGNIIRAQVYSVFAKNIEEAYKRYESSQEGGLELDVKSIEDFLIERFCDNLGIHLEDAETDFFAAGVDSLQAVQMWSIIKKELHLGRNALKLGQNVVFENQNTSKLARYLYSLRVDGGGAGRDDVEAMKRLVERYSVYAKHFPGSLPALDGHHVVGVDLAGRMV